MIVTKITKTYTSLQEDQLIEREREGFRRRERGGGAPWGRLLLLLYFTDIFIKVCYYIEVTNHIIIINFDLVTRLSSCSTDVFQLVYRHAGYIA